MTSAIDTDTIFTGLASQDLTEIRIAATDTKWHKTRGLISYGKLPPGRLIKILRQLHNGKKSPPILSSAVQMVQDIFKSHIYMKIRGRF